MLALLFQAPEPEAAAEAAAETVSGPLLTDPIPVLSLLVGVLAALFWANGHPRLNRIFKVLPLLLFCYFTPMLLSNVGLIPVEKTLPDGSKFPLYDFVFDVLLPASLMLLILSVDLQGILSLGKKAVILFLVAVGTIAIGGPLAYLALGWMVEPEAADQAWRGLAALSGSWIGGGANMAAIQKSVGASNEIVGVIIVVDVAVANVWMMCLLFFADRSKQMDARIGADRTALERVERKAEQIHLETARPTDLASLMAIVAVAFLGVWIADVGAGAANEWMLANLSEGHPLLDIVSRFTWKVLIVTFLSVGLSFTAFRHLEGAGASKVGSVFLYILVACIGAQATFAKVAEPENLPLVLVGAVWMTFHALTMLWVRKKLKAPIFFAAVGSKACVGGAASAPIVAAAFNPMLAPVGVLLAIGGYIFGTLAGLACAAGLRFANGVWFG